MCVGDYWYTRLRDYILILVSVQVHVILHGVVVIIFYHIGQSLIFLTLVICLPNMLDTIAKFVFFFV